MIYQWWIKYAVWYLRNHKEQNHIDFQRWWYWKQNKANIWRKKRKLLSHKIVKKS